MVYVSRKETRSETNLSTLFVAHSVTCVQTTVVWVTKSGTLPPNMKGHLHKWKVNSFNKSSLQFPESNLGNRCHHDPHIGGVTWQSERGTNNNLFGPERDRSGDFQSQLTASDTGGLIEVWVSFSTMRSFTSTLPSAAITATATEAIAAISPASACHFQTQLDLAISLPTCTSSGLTKVGGPQLIRG